MGVGVGGENKNQSKVNLCGSSEFQVFYGLFHSVYGSVPNSGGQLPKKQASCLENKPGKTVLSKQANKQDFLWWGCESL